MLRSLFRQFDRIGEILVAIGMVALTGTVLISMVDIVGRKLLFGFTVKGIDDIVPLTVMTCVCLAMPLAYLREGHVAVEFTTDSLPPRLLAAVKLLVALITMVFVVGLAWFAYKQARQQVGQGDVSNTLAIPIIVFWAPLVIGLAASIFSCVLLVLRFAVLAATGRDPVPARPAQGSI